MLDGVTEDQKKSNLSFSSVEQFFLNTLNTRRERVIKNFLRNKSHPDIALFGLIS